MMHRDHTTTSAELTDEMMRRVDMLSCRKPAILPFHDVRCWATVLLAVVALLTFGIILLVPVAI